MRRALTILAVTALVFTVTPADAQIGALGSIGNKIGGQKDKKELEKKKKSPAYDAISKVDILFSQIQTALAELPSKYDVAKARYDGEYMDRYSRTGERLEHIPAGVADIEKDDPKWNTDNYKKDHEQYLEKYNKMFASYLNSRAEFKIQEMISKSKKNVEGIPAVYDGAFDKDSERTLERVAYDVRELERELHLVDSLCPDADTDDFNRQLQELKINYESRLLKWNEVSKSAKFVYDFASKYGGSSFVKDWTLKKPETFRARYYEESQFAAHDKILNELKSNDPALATKFENSINEFKTSLKKLAESDLRNRLEPLFAKVEEEATSKAIQSKKTLDHIEAYTATILDMLPNNEMYKGYRTKIESHRQDIETYLAANIYTGPMHKKFLGEVKFSKKRIVIGQEKEDDFTTKFTVGDLIYGVIYLDTKAYKNYGDKVSFKKGWLDEIYFNNRASHTENHPYILFAIVPDLADNDVNKFDRSELSAMKIMESLIALESEQNAGGSGITVELFDVELQFNFTDPEGVKKLQAIYDQIVTKRSKELIPTKRYASSSTIESQARTALKSDFDKIASVVKVMSYQEEWSYTKHEFTNQVTSRYAIASGIVKGIDGKCYFVILEVRQKKVDGKFQSPHIYSTTYGSDHINAAGKLFASKSVLGDGLSCYLIDCTNQSKSEPRYHGYD